MCAEYKVLCYSIIDCYVIVVNRITLVETLKYTLCAYTWLEHNNSKLHRYPGIYLYVVQFHEPIDHIV